jgi:putative hydrolase of the HAD superfamily
MILPERPELGKDSTLMHFDPSLVSVIGLDADDTLWENEIMYKNAKEEFTQLLAPHASIETSGQILDETEVRNLEVYGYGIKSFVLSMQEAALELSRDNLDIEIANNIIKIGKRMLNSEIRIVPGVREVLPKLSDRFDLWLLTKGDLFEQTKKIDSSNLRPFFRITEVVVDKSPEVYLDLLQQNGVRPEEFVMVGNSLRSDILPVIEIGATAVYIPHEITWDHENIEIDLVDTQEYLEINQFIELLDVFKLEG